MSQFETIQASNQFEALHELDKITQPMIQEVILRVRNLRSTQSAPVKQSTHINISVTECQTGRIQAQEG